MILSILFLTNLLLVMSEYSSEDMKRLAKETSFADKTLYRMLNHLKLYTGNSLLNTLCYYNSCLKNMTSLVKADREAAQPCLDEFLKTGNPKFLEVEHSDFKLKFMMRWTDESLSTYHHLCVHAYNHWVDLMFLHHNFSKFI